MNNFMTLPIARAVMHNRIPQYQYETLRHLIGVHRADGQLSAQDTSTLRSIIATLVSPEKLEIAMDAVFRRMGPPMPSSLLGICHGIESKEVPQ